MRPATSPVQRPPDARLLVVDASGQTRHASRARLADALRPGDLLVANDAATIPGSLAGTHVPTGRPVEIRLAAWRRPAAPDVRRLVGLAFGAGDHRTRTEDRPDPPPLAAGDRLALGPLVATVRGRLGHPRLVALDLDGEPDAVWAGIAAHGRPVQYAHVDRPLATWDVWTTLASVPFAFEPPSATFALDWKLVRALAHRGVGLATLTMAAGLSSTGDPRLDARLPLDEPYRIPAATVRQIRAARARGGRVVALGTTVTRALEHAAGAGEPGRGAGVATQRLGPDSGLRIVDAVITGVHESDTGHYQLLRAFVPDGVLHRVSRVLAEGGYRAHEFGDSVLLERMSRGAGRGALLTDGPVPAFVADRR